MVSFSVNILSKYFYIITKKENTNNTFLKYLALSWTSIKGIWAYLQQIYYHSYKLENK